MNRRKHLTLWRVTLIRCGWRGSTGARDMSCPRGDTLGAHTVGARGPRKWHGPRCWHIGRDKKPLARRVLTCVAKTPPKKACAHA
jgi:hypothetical protein